MSKSGTIKPAIFTMSQYVSKKDMYAAMQDRIEELEQMVDHQAKTMQSMSECIVKFKAELATMDAAFIEQTEKTGKIYEENAQLKELVRESRDSMWAIEDAEWQDKARKLLGAE